MKSKTSPQAPTTEQSLEQHIDAVARLIEKGQRILVVSHVDPDGDALGTQLAWARYLESLGKKVFLVRDGGIPEKYRFLDGVNDIPHVSELPDGFAVDTLVTLECPRLIRMGAVLKYVSDEVTIINIDHHRENDRFGQVNWVDIDASSVGEMSYEYFCRVGYDVPAAVAEQLYTAILTDTGRFRFHTTTKRTMQIAGCLIEAGADPKKIADCTYYDQSPSSMKLVGKVLHEIEFHRDGQICVLTLTRAMLAESGADLSESEGLIDYTMYTKGVLVGAFFKEVSDRETRVSLRSRDGINVSEIAAMLGGGGHFNAAGCTVTGNVEEARKKICNLISEVLDAQA